MIGLMVAGAVSGMLVTPLTPETLAGGCLAEAVGISVAAPIAAWAVGYYDRVPFDYLSALLFTGVGSILLGGGYMVAFVVRMVLADRKAGPRPPAGPLWPPEGVETSGDELAPSARRAAVGQAIRDRSRGGERLVRVA